MRSRSSNPNAGSLLVSLVGLNPASTLFSERALQPDRMVLVHTRESEDQARALASQLSCPSDRLVWEPSLGIDEARKSIRSGLASRAERVVIDLTGGTKLMSIGAWHGLIERYGDVVDGVYVDQKSLALLDARSGLRLRVTEPRAEIHPNEVLEWYGGQLRRVAWRGYLSAIPDDIWERFELECHLLRAFGRREVRAGIDRRGGMQVPPSALPPSLPAGMRYEKNGRLYSDSTSFLGQNVWLEELCLALASAAAGDRASEVVAAHGMVAYAGSGGEDEMDIVLMRGPRTVVIEAKARGSRAGAGADVHKRIQKARRFLGSHVQVIIVIPAWGEEAPDNLRDLTENHAVLVGAEEGRLRDEIRRALGF